jgi:hypothetical protein
LNRELDEAEKEPGAAGNGMQERRTGVVFLSLVVATTFIPWMQLVEGGADASFISPTESGLVLATCFLSVGGLIAAWLAGRRLPPETGPRVNRPRDAGLVLAILAAAANLLLAAVLRGRMSGAHGSFAQELQWFGPVWFLLVVPVQIAAGYCKGRASIPIRKPAGVVSAGLPGAP